jgi:hypothetical protein
MHPKVSERLDGIPVRSVKARLDSVPKLTADTEQVQKPKPAPGEVLEGARAAVRLEPKQMASDMDISHSLVLRGLKDGQLSFGRLWDLPDAYWLELVMRIIEARKLARVRRRVVFEVA